MKDSVKVRLKILWVRFKRWIKPNLNFNNVSAITGIILSLAAIWLSQVSIDIAETALNQATKIEDMNTLLKKQDKIIETQLGLILRQDTVIDKLKNIVVTLDKTQNYVVQQLNELKLQTKANEPEFIVDQGIHLLRIKPTIPDQYSVIVPFKNAGKRAGTVTRVEFEWVYRSNGQLIRFVHHQSLNTNNKFLNIHEPEIKFERTVTEQQKKALEDGYFIFAIDFEDRLTKEKYKSIQYYKTRKWNDINDSELKTYVLSSLSPSELLELKLYNKDNSK